MELDKDFNEFVELFIAHDVQFLIIGGSAQHTVYRGRQET